MKVLVTVSGGIATAAADKGVEVYIFDWDDYNDAGPEDKQDMALTSDWKDLAEEAGVPLRREYPLSDWQHEVANGDTLLGFDDWQLHKFESEVQP